jgi:hypothetical protein
MIRIYIAGAYSASNVIDVFGNMRRGIALSYQVLQAGFAPFAPWFDYPFGLIGEVGYEKYFAYSMAWLEKSDAILVVPENWEQSKGTKAELSRATELGIPIFWKLEDLKEYFDAK